MIKPHKPHLRNPLKNARGLGSAKDGTGHFIVQRVTGTANRGIYQMAVLVDPSRPIEPWSADQPWSGKLLYTFGGACGTEHRQLAPASVLGQAQAQLPAAPSPPAGPA